MIAKPDIKVTPANGSDLSAFPASGRDLIVLFSNYNID